MSSLQGDNQSPLLLYEGAIFLLPFKLLCGIFSRLAIRGHYSFAMDYLSANIGAMSLLVVSNCGPQSYSIETFVDRFNFIAAQLKSVERAHISALISIEVHRYL